MGLFSRNSVSDTPAPPPSTSTVGGRKPGPTPTRKEAEAARRQRVNRPLTKKESRAASTAQNRSARMRAMAQRDATPEKALFRDYIDARFSLGELLLPSLVVILLLTFLTNVLPAVAQITTVVMYLFILAVLLDCFWMWRGFRRVLAARLPGSSTRGLLSYGVNRAIQIRRFRMPAPRVKRGDSY